MVEFGWGLLTGLGLALAIYIWRIGIERELERRLAGLRDALKMKEQEVAEQLKKKL